MYPIITGFRIERQLCGNALYAPGRGYDGKTELSYGRLQKRILVQLTQYYEGTRNIRTSFFCWLSNWYVNHESMIKT